MTSVNLDDPNSIPFGQLSPYNDKVLISYERGYTKDVSTSVVAFVYGGLIKHPNSRQLILREFPRLVREKAITMYYAERNQIIIDAVKKALAQKYKNIQSKKALLQTGSRLIDFVPGVDIFANNIIGEEMMAIRHRIRQNERSNIVDRAQQQERENIGWLYRVQQELERLHNASKDIKKYDFVHYKQIARDLRIDHENADGRISRKNLTPELRMILEDDELAGILSFWISLRRGYDDSDSEILVRNKNKVMNAFFSSKGFSDADIQTHLSAMDDSTKNDMMTRIFFLWKKGAIAIDVDVEDAPKAVAMSFDEIVAKYNQNISEEKRQQLIKIGSQDNGDVTMADISNIEGGQPIQIQDVNSQDIHSLNFQQTIEMGNYTFPSVISYIFYEGLRNLNVDHSVAYNLSHGDVMALINFYYKNVNSNIDRVVRERVPIAVSNLYRKNIQTVHNKLDRLLVTTGDEPLNLKLTEAVDPLFVELFPAELSKIRENLKWANVLPFSDEELPKAPIDVTMTDVIPNEAEKKWLLSEVNEVVRGLKLFRECQAKKGKNEPLSKKNVDKVMNLYTMCFDSKAVKGNINVESAELPADFVQHIHRTEKLGKYAIDQVWSYLLFLRSGFSTLYRSSVTEQTIEQFKNISSRLTQRSLQTDPAGRVLFSSGMDVKDRVKKNHIANAFLSILYTVQPSTGMVKWDAADFEFASSLLSGSKSSNSTNNSNSDNIIRFLQSNSMLKETDVNTISRIVGNALDLCTDEKAMGRVSAFEIKESFQRDDDDIFDRGGDGEENHGIGKDENDVGMDDEELKKDADSDDEGNVEDVESDDDNDNEDNIVQNAKKERARRQKLKDSMKNDKDDKKKVTLEDLLHTESDNSDNEGGGEGDGGDYDDDGGRFDNDD